MPESQYSYGKITTVGIKNISLHYPGLLQTDFTFGRNMHKLSNGNLVCIFSWCANVTIYGTRKYRVNYEIWLSEDNGATWNVVNEATWNVNGTTGYNGKVFFGSALDQDDNLYFDIQLRYASTNSHMQFAGQVNANKNAWTINLIQTIALTSAQSAADTVEMVAIKIGSNYYTHTVTGYTTLIHIQTTYNNSLVKTATATTTIYTGTASNGVTIDFEHTGDGVTPKAAPHLHIAYANGGTNLAIWHRKATYSAGTWSWEAVEDISSYFKPNGLRIEWQNYGSMDLSSYYDGTDFVVGGAIEEYASGLTFCIACVVADDSKWAVEVPIGDAKFFHSALFAGLYRNIVSHIGENILFMFYYSDINASPLHEGWFLYKTPKTGTPPAFDDSIYLAADTPNIGLLSLIPCLMRHQNSKLFWAGYITGSGPI